MHSTRVEETGHPCDDLEPEFYSRADFSRVPKFDAHVHANLDDPSLVEQACEDGFELMTINVTSPDFPDIAEQRAVAMRLAARYPGRVHWATTFSMGGVGQPGWSERVAIGLEAARADGARAVKVWKDVGMSARDAQGRLVMLDHPDVAQAVAHVRALGMVLIGHQGEPHNCWLPLDEMTDEGDRRYFRRRPQFHMHRHPDLPSHDDLIAMRDRFLSDHPGLSFVAAHLGSLEHDVDRLSEFLDRFPDVVVDTSSRMSQLQHHSSRDQERVRDFFLRHQDRVLYGTDLTFTAQADPERFRRAAHRIWTSDWLYLATAESQHIAAIGADVRGLALPRSVIDKLYRRNASRVFGIDQRSTGRGTGISADGGQVREGTRSSA